MHTADVQFNNIARCLVTHVCHSLALRTSVLSLPELFRRARGGEARRKSNVLCFQCERASGRKRVCLLVHECKQ